MINRGFKVKQEKGKYDNFKGLNLIKFCICQPQKKVNFFHRRNSFSQFIFFFKKECIFVKKKIDSYLKKRHLYNFPITTWKTLSSLFKRNFVTTFTKRKKNTIKAEKKLCSRVFRAKLPSRFHLNCYFNEIINFVPVYKNRVNFASVFVTRHNHLHQTHSRSFSQRVYSIENTKGPWYLPVLLFIILQLSVMQMDNKIAKIFIIQYIT